MGVEPKSNFRVDLCAMRSFTRKQSAPVHGLELWEPFKSKFQFLCGRFELKDLAKTKKDVSVRERTSLWWDCKRINYIILTNQMTHRVTSLGFLVSRGSATVQRTHPCKTCYQPRDCVQRSLGIILKNLFSIKSLKNFQNRVSHVYHTCPRNTRHPNPSYPSRSRKRRCSEHCSCARQCC